MCSRERRDGLLRSGKCQIRSDGRMEKFEKFEYKNEEISG